MRKVVSMTFVLVSLSSSVECRYCTYFTPDGYVRSITCQPYEFCCGNSCCRSTFKFYQFWYFWLSVILILLVCSGGSWWYRLRYRHQFFTHRYSSDAPVDLMLNRAMHRGSSDNRNSGVMYYTTFERVFFQHQPKDLNGQVVAPPTYAQANSAGSTASTQCPGFQNGPPPPYEMVVGLPTHQPLSNHVNNSAQTINSEQNSQTQASSSNQPPFY
ncbi:hypothetical protein CHUAL_007343 [Chamberlinius hualienensis]